MKESIFRKKSIDKVSSPEQLNEYIRVSNPGVWLVLGAVIVLLIGVCVWGIFGNLNTTLDAVGSCEDGTLTCYVTKADLEKVKEGLPVTVEGKEYIVSEVNKTAVKVENSLSEYLAYLGGFTADEWVYSVTVEADLPDGDYEVEIVVESISPISFVLN